MWLHRTEDRDTYPCHCSGRENTVSDHRRDIHLRVHFIQGRGEGFFKPWKTVPLSPSTQWGRNKHHRSWRSVCSQSTTLFQTETKCLEQFTRKSNSRTKSIPIQPDPKKMCSRYFVCLCHHRTVVLVVSFDGQQLPERNLLNQLRNFFLFLYLFLPYMLVQRS